MVTILIGLLLEFPLITQYFVFHEKFFTYPIILIPYDLSHARTNKPAMPIFKEHLPAAPREELNPDSFDKAVS